MRVRRVRRALASRLLQGARGGLRVFALKSRARRGRSLPSLFVFDEASNTADPFRRPMDLESADRALPEPAATNTYMLPGAASGALKAWRGSVAHQIFSHVSRGTGTEDTEDDSEGEEEAKAREPPRGRAEALAQKAHQALEELVELRRQQLLPTLRPEPRAPGWLPSSAATEEGRERATLAACCFLRLRSWQETAPGRSAGSSHADAAKLSLLRVWKPCPGATATAWRGSLEKETTTTSSLRVGLEVTMVQARCSLPAPIPSSSQQALRDESGNLGPACCPSIVWTWSERQRSPARAMRAMRGRGEGSLLCVGCVDSEVLSSQWQLSAALELGAEAGGAAATFEARVCGVWVWVWVWVWV